MYILISFLKTDAASQNVYDVAEAAKSVLKASTRDCFINESSSLVNA